MNRTIVTLAFVSLVAAGALRAADTLDIYFIDTEGGQATLLVTPAGQTMLIDSGFADADNAVARDASRIAAAARLANANRIDVFLPTHFHGDHVGVRPAIRKIPSRLAW